MRFWEENREENVLIDVERRNHFREECRVWSELYLVLMEDSIRGICSESVKFPNSSRRCNSNEKGRLPGAVQQVSGSQRLKGGTHELSQHEVQVPGRGRSPDLRVQSFQASTKPGNHVVREDCTACLARMEGGNGCKMHSYRRD